jgi:ribosomal protein S18 acetylase RimI-like enzyme
MRSYTVRPLCRTDFDALMRLEEEVFVAEGESALGAYYVRLCCEFFRDTCFVALDGERHVGYVLTFVQEREAYCTTLAVLPEYRRSRVVHALVGALVRALLLRVDSCWFTVKADNGSARSLHAGLGARDVEVRRDFYGPGDDRIVSRIDRDDLVRAARRYARLAAAFDDASPELGSAA